MWDCYVEVFEVLLDVSHNGFANRKVGWGLVYAYGEFFGLSRSFEVEVDSASVGVEFAWVGDGSSRFKDWCPASVWFLGGGGSPSVEELLDGMRVPACPGLVGLFFPEALLDLQCCAHPIGLVVGLVSRGTEFVEVEWGTSFEGVAL